MLIENSEFLELADQSCLGGYSLVTLLERGLQVHVQEGERVLQGGYGPLFGVNSLFQRLNGRGQERVDLDADDRVGPFNHSLWLLTADFGRLSECLACLSVGEALIEVALYSAKCCQIVVGIASLASRPPELLSGTFAEVGGESSAPEPQGGRRYAQSEGDVAWTVHGADPNMREFRVR